MIYQGEEIPAGQELVGEICVVGAGAAGITCALELERYGKKVILLEAGGIERSKESQRLYAGKSTGMPYSISHTRLRVFGGTTEHWSGFCAPLDSEDFERKNYIKYSGWPITREELNPYYKKAAKILKLGQYNDNPDHWIDEKNGFMRYPYGEDLTEKIWHFSPPVRFGRDYKKHFEKSENVDVFLNSPVVDMTLDESTSRVGRVTVQSADKRYYVRAKKIILACGGLEVPRLLLNFNKQIAKGLGNESDNVGRFFQEHPEFHRAGTLLITGPTAHSKLYRGHTRKLKTRIAGFTQISNEIRVQKKLLSMAFYQLGADQLDDLGKEIQYYSNNLYGHQKYKDNIRVFRFIAEQEPNRDCRVQLDSKKDALGLFQPKLNLGLTDFDIRSMRDSVSTFANIISKHNIGKVKLLYPEMLESTREVVKKYMGWGNHHMGATRMSKNPSEGVVDTNCKVHTVDNLYIGSPSVFVTSGCSNPTFTIVALAVRLAEHVNNTL